ncbi:MAG TPA: efflux RND transporter periplasmic adaptor subunit [Flavobacteriales bacterium]|nr:efflux RND transporter periplasmic adaptor subunit [Flavobacteriales bacterium]
MPNTFYRAILLLVYVIFIVSCGTEEVTDQKPVTKVSVIIPIKKDVPVTSVFVGEVKGLYDIPIRARVDGYLEEKLFQEGSLVKKGQLLYVIDAQPYKAEVASKSSEVAEARTILVKAENELRRIRPLAEINAVSQMDLDAAIAEEGAARAALDAAEANHEIALIKLSYTRIHSPITGVIGKTKAELGEYVGQFPNPVILNTVSRLDTILVQFFITESNYLKVAREFIAVNKSMMSGHNANKAKERNLELILSDGSVHPYKGAVDFIDREVDSETGSIMVQASFQNPEGLVRPGQFARINVLMRTEKDAVLIPWRSVVEVQGKTNVYVLNDSSQVEMREIISSHKYGDLILVDEGLKHGEKVLVDGIQRVRSGMTVEAVTDTFISKSSNPF